jgi:hypothetical protein
LNRFDVEAGQRILSILRELKNDFYSSDAKYTVSDLGEMGDRAAGQFREKHPKLPGEIAQILAWCYTFSYK